MICKMPHALRVRMRRALHSPALMSAYLLRAPAFKHDVSDVADALLAAGSIEVYAAGVQLITAGRAVPELLFLLSGTVRACSSGSAHGNGVHRSASRALLNRVSSTVKLRLGQHSRRPSSSQLEGDEDSSHGDGPHSDGDCLTDHARGVLMVAAAQGAQGVGVRHGVAVELGAGTVLGEAAFFARSPAAVVCLQPSHLPCLR